MGENIQLHWGVSGVESSALDLLEDEERRCLDLSILQISILRQMVFPWALLPSRLVESHDGYQTIVEMPVAYLEALEELEILLSGAYDGPETGCPVGEQYVDRGDLPGWDFTLGMLTADDAWHELDMTNVIGAPDATRLLLGVTFTASGVGAVVQFRTAGNVDVVNTLTARAQVIGLWNDLHGQAVMSIAQKIEYLLSSTITAIYVVVRGYWTPAT